ncbi:aminodeoxychorismate synthase component I [Pseudolysobacter antarcticus]|uniref:Aminodeoxychorismate synthase component I n=1 Tax=Pseudolysobacter antarcticus TaxID=2511995 RepID=A0A411HI72_9GAMM|nr:aminodeoxychorismate synthase component I [Pseudolysobacter antarcticus]QBB70232.1 aminodeoxychorismate synthase component I [Pseudolysobacter antarcticus]
MSIVTRVLTGQHDLLALAAAQPARYPALFESVASGTRHARFDILCAFPQAQIRLDADHILTHDGTAIETHHGFLDALDSAWSAENIPHSHDDLPFHGGWLLYLGYELAGEIEPRLQQPRATENTVPVALAMRCPAAIIIDHELDRTVLIAETAHADLLDLLFADLQSAKPAIFPALTDIAIDEDDPEIFLRGIERIHEYLRAGDIFQVNLSREWRARWSAPVSPAALYARLRQTNPAPFAGLLQLDDWAVVSSSPERLVEVRAGVAQTRPIAGTRARFAGDDDVDRMRELVGHPKERAEHVMLIDLERNDLGRVCVPGSVEVDELMSVESYTHVHHIVSNVRGRLRVGVTPGQVIAAVFPGGTITGCPKVRCMEIIAELEGVARGAYTGAFGYLDRNGDMDLNILIRSFLLQDRRISFRAGAGIVVDSIAERELDETRAKARGLLRALGVDE